MNLKDKMEPHIIINPITEEPVNISPLWYIIHEHYDDDFKELSANLDKIIRKLCLEMHDEISRKEEKNMLYDLFNIKDIIDNLSK